MAAPTTVSVYPCLRHTRSVSCWDGNSLVTVTGTFSIVIGTLHYVNGSRKRDSELVGGGGAMRVYLRDGSAQTILRAATLR